MHMPIMHIIPIIMLSQRRIDMCCGLLLSCDGLIIFLPMRYVNMEFFTVLHKSDTRILSQLNNPYSGSCILGGFVVKYGKCRA